MITRQRATVATIVGALAGLAPAMAWAGSPATTAAASSVVVTVTNPGDPTTAVDLTPVATVGTTIVSESTEALIGEWSGPGSTERYDVSGTSSGRSTVIAAYPDGGTTVTAVLDSSTTTENAGNNAEDAFTEDQENLVGVPLDMEFDVHGARVAIRPSATAAPTPGQLESIAVYVEVGATGPVVAPAEPVGVGATWVATLAYADGALDLPLAYSYRLSAVDGDRVTIDFTWSADVPAVTVRPSAAADYAGFTVSATVTGTGSMTGAVTGTDTTVTTHGHFRFVYAGGGAEIVDEFDYWTASSSHPG